LQGGSDIPPELMQALIEAEQLKHYLESSKPKRVKRLEWNEAEGRLEEVD